MNDAVKYFQKNGLQRSRELVEMGFGFCSSEDGLSFHTDQLKQLVKSHDLVASWGGLADAKVAVKLRLDPDLLAVLKATGPGWQTRANRILRDRFALE